MIEIYFLLNLSVAIAYGAFLFVGFIGRYLFPLMSFRTLAKCAQVLFAIALVSPVAISLVPREAAPPFSAIILAPLAEASEELGIRSFVTAPADSTKQGPIDPEETIPLPSWREAFSFAALLGFFVFAAIQVTSAMRLNRLLQDSSIVRRVGKVRVVASQSIGVPLSTRLGGKAWIVVPESLLSDWVDFKLALKHEIQHHRQGDTLWVLFIDACIPVFFFNPFIYLWKTRISEIQELSCDEALIGHKVSSYDYGSCLVRVAEAALKNREMLVGTASMAAGFENPIYLKSFLKRRIEMLTQHRFKRPCRLAGMVMGTLGAVFISALVFSARFSLATAESNSMAGEVETVPGVQKIAEAALSAAIKRHKASLGFVVVADANSGQLLAVANQDLVSPETRRTPHWALSLRVEPASISKALITAAAIDKGLTSPAEIHNCEMGKYTVAGKLFQDWKAFDRLSTTEAVAQSSNICGIKVGEKLGANKILEAFSSFGFGPGGSAEGFPEARVGTVPAASKSKETETLQTAVLSSGYSGVYASPIEIVQAIGAIANGGNLLRPQAGKQVKPEVVRRVLSSETSAKMKEILTAVMDHGTAQKSQSNLYRLAGKTATGYGPSHGGHDTLGGESNMGSFVGFGPVDKPKIVIYVAIENPADGQGVHGAYHAAPVFREVAEKTLEYLHVPTI